MGRFNFPLMFEDSVLQNQFLHIYHLMGYLESGEIKEVKKIIIRQKKYFGPIVQPLDSLSTTML